MFFLELHHQSAEDLPETFQARDVDLQIAADNGEQAEGEPQSYMYQVSNVAEIFSWTPEAAIAQNIMALSTVDLSAVPIRHLPPGKPMSLFWQFQAWCEAAESLAGSQFKGIMVNFLARVVGEVVARAPVSENIPAQGVQPAIAFVKSFRERRAGQLRRWRLPGTGVSIFARSIMTGSFIGVCVGHRVPVSTC